MKKPKKEHREILKTCPNCGKKFRTVFLRKKYCTPKCQRDMAKKRAKSNLQAKICEYCGRQFKTTRPTQKYCSINCRLSERKKRDKARYLETAWVKLRFEILRRDNFTCQYCGRTVKDGAKLRVDHIIPKAKEGIFDKNNLITACEKCNSGKSDVLLTQEEIKRLRRK